MSITNIDDIGESHESRGDEVWSEYSRIYSTEVSSDTFSKIIEYTNPDAETDLNDEEISVNIYLNQKYVNNNKSDSKVVITGKGSEFSYRDDIHEEDFKIDYEEGEWVRPDSETVANDIKSLIERLEK